MSSMICNSVRRLSGVVLMSAALLPWAARAQGATQPGAQVRRGETIAQAQCSACHIVAEKQQFLPLLKEPAPSFESIANRPQTSEKTLRHFVTTTHWDLKTVPITMPNPELSKADTTAVIRYILSLRGH